MTDATAASACASPAAKPVAWTQAASRLLLRRACPAARSPRRRVGAAASRAATTATGCASPATHAAPEHIESCLGLPRLGRDPHVPVALLDVPLVAHPLRRRRLRVLRATHASSASGGACRLCWETAPRPPATRPRVSTSPTPPGSASSCSSPTRRARAGTATDRNAPRPSTGSRRTRPAAPGGIPTGQRFEPVRWTSSPCSTSSADRRDRRAAPAARQRAGRATATRSSATTPPRTAGAASTPTTSAAALRLVAGRCSTHPSAKISASDVLKLPRSQANISALSTLDVLAAAGLLDDDRLPPVERYFNAPDRRAARADDRRAAHLVRRACSTAARTPPRRRPRGPGDRQARTIRAIARSPARWAAQGHDLAAPRSTAPTSSPPCPPTRPAPPRRRPRPPLAVQRPQGPQARLHQPDRAACRTGTNATDPAAARHRRDPRTRSTRPTPPPRSAVALVAFHALAQPPAARLCNSPTSSTAASPRRPRHPARRTRCSPRLAAWLDHRNATLAAHRQPAPVHQPAHRATAHRRSAARFPWNQVGIAPRPCARTASSTRSAPPAATSAASANCSASASTPPCATTAPTLDQPDRDATDNADSTDTPAGRDRLPT